MEPGRIKRAGQTGLFIKPRLLSVVDQPEFLRSSSTPKAAKVIFCPHQRFRGTHPRGGLRERFRPAVRQPSLQLGVGVGSRHYNQNPVRHSNGVVAQRFPSTASACSRFPNRTCNIKSRGKRCSRGCPRSRSTCGPRSITCGEDASEARRLLFGGWFEGVMQKVLHPPPAPLASFQEFG